MSEISPLLFIRLYSLDRPVRGFGEDGIVCCLPGFELLGEARVAAVAHGDGDVAVQAFAAGAFDGGALEPLLECLRVHAGEPVERGVDQLGPGEHSFARGDWRFPVPGADVLADVAAEDLAAHGFAQFCGDGALLFDGEVGDAARGIHLVWRDEGVGGAGVDAAGAGAAAVGGDLQGSVGGDGDGGDDDGEEKPGAELLINDAGVFADPADAGFGGEGALDEGAGVDVAAGLAGEAVLQGGFEVMEAVEELVVVVGGEEVCLDLCLGLGLGRSRRSGLSSRCWVVRCRWRAGRGRCS